MAYPVARVVNLIAPESQRLWSSSVAEAEERIRRGESAGVLDLDGSFEALGATFRVGRG